MTKTQLAMLNRYLDAPYGSEEAWAALDELITLADKGRDYERLYV